MNFFTNFKIKSFLLDTFHNSQLLLNVKIYLNKKLNKIIKIIAKTRDSLRKIDFYGKISNVNNRGTIIVKEGEQNEKV